MPEIAVECEDIARSRQIGKMDQARVGKIGRRVAIFPHKLAKLRDAFSGAKGDCEGTIFNAGEHVVNGWRGMAQKMKRLRDASFAGDERNFDGLVRRNTAAVGEFSLVVVAN
jgi:hypothetical protein